MHSAYCSPTVNTHLAKIINYSNKELARPGTCPAWSGVGVWVARAQALCSSHCDGWQQPATVLAILSGFVLLAMLEVHFIALDFDPRNTWYIKRVLCPWWWYWCRHLCISPRCGWSWCWHNVGWRPAAADNVVSGQVSGLSLHQHLGMATITVGIDTSRVYNRCTQETMVTLCTVERRWLNTN